MSQETTEVAKLVMVAAKALLSSKKYDHLEDFWSQVLEVDRSSFSEDFFLQMDGENSNLHKIFISRFYPIDEVDEKSLKYFFVTLDSFCDYAAHIFNEAHMDFNQYDSLKRSCFLYSVFSHVHECLQNNTPPETAEIAFRLKDAMEEGVITEHDSIELSGHYNQLYEEMAIRSSTPTLQRSLNAVFEQIDIEGVDIKRREVIQALFLILDVEITIEEEEFLRDNFDQAIIKEYGISGPLSDFLNQHNHLVESSSQTPRKSRISSMITTGTGTETNLTITEVGLPSKIQKTDDKPFNVELFEKLGSLPVKDQRKALEFLISLTQSSGSQPVITQESSLDASFEGFDDVKHTLNMNEEDEEVEVESEEEETEEVEAGEAGEVQSEEAEEEEAEEEEAEEEIEEEEEEIEEEEEEEIEEEEIEEEEEEIEEEEEEIEEEEEVEQLDELPYNGFEPAATSNEFDFLTQTLNSEPEEEVSEEVSEEPTGSDIQLNQVHEQMVSGTKSIVCNSPTPNVANMMADEKYTGELDAIMNLVEQEELEDIAIEPPNRIIVRTDMVAAMGRENSERLMFEDTQKIIKVIRDYDATECGQNQIVRHEFYYDYIAKNSVEVSLSWEVDCFLFALFLQCHHALQQEEKPLFGFSDIPDLTEAQMLQKETIVALQEKPTDGCEMPSEMSVPLSSLTDNVSLDSSSLFFAANSHPAFNTDENDPVFSLVKDYYDQELHEGGFFRILRENNHYKNIEQRICEKIIPVDPRMPGLIPINRQSKEVAQNVSKKDKRNRRPRVTVTTLEYWALIKSVNITPNGYWSDRLNLFFYALEYTRMVNSVYARKYWKKSRESLRSVYDPVLQMHCPIEFYANPSIGSVNEIQAMILHGIKKRKIFSDKIKEMPEPLSRLVWRSVLLYMLKDMNVSVIPSILTKYHLIKKNDDDLVEDEIEELDVKEFVFKKLDKLVKNGVFRCRALRRHQFNTIPDEFKQFLLFK
ncbi:hypothetical protein PCE1_002951 [Barthelona sp. PCE]